MLYWKNIGKAFSTLSEGLKLSIKHFLDARFRRYPLGPDDETYFSQNKGIFTIRYPRESMPVPENGRYKLHNEIDDCIVCDKCAKICPVDCIDIDPIKSVGTFGTTSDGTPKRLYAAKFDIDMAKCCFCGLCTTVCPTECLTMTPEYDFSAFDISNHTFSFANMSEELIALKRKEWDEYAKSTEPGQGNANMQTEITPEKRGGKFVPKMKVKMPLKGKNDESSKPIPPKKKKPLMKKKPVMKPNKEHDESSLGGSKTTGKYIPKMKPVIKKTKGENPEKGES